MMEYICVQEKFKYLNKDIFSPFIKYYTNHFMDMSTILVRNIHFLLIGRMKNISQRWYFLIVTSWLCYNSYVLYKSTEISRIKQFPYHVIFEVTFSRVGSGHTCMYV